MSDSGSVKQAPAKSLTPLWIMIGSCTVLMVFLGGDHSVYSHVMGRGVGAPPRQPVCCARFVPLPLPPPAPLAPAHPCDYACAGHAPAL